MKTFITLLLLGLAVLSSAQPPCQIRLYKSGSNDAVLYDGTNNVAPFTGSGLNPQDPSEPANPVNTISSANLAEALFCDSCVLTVYSTNSFSGNSQVYNNMETPYQLYFPFCVKSFTLDCNGGSGNPGGQEEEEEEEEEQELGQQPE